MGKKKKDSNQLYFSFSTEGNICEKNELIKNSDVQEDKCKVIRLGSYTDEKNDELRERFYSLSDYID